LEKAPEGAAARIAGSVSSNIVKKTCGARPSTAAKGVDCLVGLVELEQAEKVMVSSSNMGHGGLFQPSGLVCLPAPCPHEYKAKLTMVRLLVQLLWQAALMEGYTNKVPKVVVGALDNTLILIR